MKQKERMDKKVKQERTEPGTHAKWQAIQVLRILKNEVYTGTMVQGKRQKINYKDAITLVSVI